MDTNDDNDIANLYGLFHGLRASQAATEHLLAGLMSALDGAAPAVRDVVAQHLDERWEHASRMKEKEDDAYDMEMNAIDDIRWVIDPDRRQPL
jgi:hypothetical protein